MSTVQEQISGMNVNNPPIKVEHASLIRADENSLYRSCCPMCKEGLLLVRRSGCGGRLERDDCCILCGQKVHYVGKLGFFEGEQPKNAE